LSASQKIKLRGDISGAKAIRKGHQAKGQELPVSLGRAKNSRVTDSINNQLANIMLDIERQDALIKKHEEKLAKSELPALTPEEFAERVRKMAAKFKKATGVQKDIIVQNLFLNLRVNNEKITSYLWAEPFATLLEVSVLQNGRGDRT
jgi:hypothetical protein